MGEVVVSSEGAAASMMAVAVAEEEERKSEREVVKWERFLPRMSLRVLLVEADDSTRQIITALLRKCSYKVAAVPDGLKAWEVLKARPHNIDLILTEVELPSVSGYALLTLIMEHDICKNIPVIMMSTHDPVSTVYNCMLRGAADFLVKPIRINELRNLWQHVWRRQSMNRGSEPRDESVAQQAVEATAENNAASDHLSGSKACLPRQEGIKKGSDAQSSCGKPEMEAESAYKEEADNCSVPSLRKSLACDANTQSLFSHEPGAADGRMEVHTYEKVANSAPEAIDLIGAFGDHSRHDHGFSSSNHVANVFESSPQLDLSLRRFYHYGLEDKSIHERHNLNHSNASAFTRYVNKARKEETTNFVGHLSDGIHKPDLNAKGALPSYNRKVISPPVLDQTEQSERESEPTPERLFPIPLPVREISLDAVCTGYRSPIPPILSRPLPLQAPSSDALPLCESNFNRMNSGRFYNTIDQSPRLSSSHATNKHEMRFDFVEDRAHISSAMDQSASSCGVGGVPISNGNVEENQAICDGNRQRSIQREAALSKFRMKRKERCYEKKVRYESRKKLAEQRPRVKGQFVRQVPPDPPPLICNNSYGNSVMSR